MNNKTLITLAVVTLVIVGVAVFLKMLGSGDYRSGREGDFSGLSVGSNAIYIAEQAPGNSVSVQVARLEKPGFVVIHGDASEAPGEILGVSGLLQEGEAKNLPAITLSRATKSGETIYAMLHFDDGDGKFQAENDKPAFDASSGEPVMMIVSISEDAMEAGEVNL